MPSLETTSVGIFWFVRAADGTLHLLVHTVPLSEAEPYGDCLTSPHGHYDVWTEWARGRGSVPSGLRPMIAVTEYEAWPRGRVVFDRVQDRFTVFADDRILRRGLVARVRDAFGLPPERTLSRWDSHYRSTERI